jgi:glycosyltransferase A (GT-A) superfamily protein (DUF2064 family)
MARLLVLFAREPRREAREKGLAAAGAADLFTAFGRGWCEAARRVGARLAVATPPEDLLSWRRVLPVEIDPVWIAQRGGSFGERLEDAARRAAELGGHALLVGGDVAPRTGALAEAFEALEQGVHAVLSPAPDGGVSLVGLAREDLDLLGAFGIRRRDVFAALVGALTRRGRCVRILGGAPDVDGRRGLRSILRSRVPTGLRCLARLAAQQPPRIRLSPIASPSVPELRSLIRLRAPPAA